MKKIYSFVIGIFTLTSFISQAQCPTATGMTATPISFSGNCFINIQFAIPASRVLISNASGYVAQGTANATGNVIISYPCSGNPITNILSITPAGQTCNTFTITQLIALPVKLVSFTASLSERKTVLLKWETALELNNEKYEIQRSEDGITYTTLGTINSNGSGVVKRIYDFEDAAFVTGTAYFYRLQQIDYDGKTSFSKVLYVNDKASPSDNYALFPNPLNSSNSTIQIKGIAATDVTYSNIRISDMAGKNIAYKIVGANAIEMAPTAPSGIYLIRVKDKTLKLVKN